MHKIFLIAVLVTQFSCHNRIIPHQENWSEKNIQIVQYDSVKMKLDAINLSEDLGVMSTKNDELLLMIYPFVDSTSLGEPILFEAFVADSINKEFNFTFLPVKSASIHFLIALIEIDSDNSSFEIEKIVRLNYSLLFRACKMKDYKKIEELIGDDDILVMELIENWRFAVPNRKIYDGVHRADKFEYHFDFLPGEGVKYE